MTLTAQLTCAVLCAVHIRTGTETAGCLPQGDNKVHTVNVITYNVSTDD